MSSTINNSPAQFADGFGFAEETNALQIINVDDGIFRFHMYKNWGGPGWANAQWVNDGWLQNSTILISPADKLDACFKEHDICYEKCRQTYNCPGELYNCFSICDANAVNCQLSVIIAPWSVNGDYSFLGLVAAPLGITVLKMQQLKNIFTSSLLTVLGEL